MNEEFNPNAQPNPEQSQNAENGGGTAAQDPPPRPEYDPFLDELNQCFDQLNQARERLRALAAKEGVPPELSEALNQIGSRSAADQMREALNQAIINDAADWAGGAIKRDRGQARPSAGEYYREQFKQFTQEAQKLHRVDKGKMVAGVCTGLADYFNADPAVVRIIFIVTGIMFFIPPVFLLSWVTYLALAIILPLKDA